MVLRSSALLVCCLATVAARAQTAPADKVVAGEPVEIRESRLPASAATSSRLALAGDGSESGVALAAAEAAGLYLADGGARSFTSTLALRGLANTPLFGDPAATVYLDDLPLGSTFAVPSELTGFTSVEVLRGPGQNTRFGRAGSAGVLRFSTPTVAAGVTESLQASYGNFDARSVSARVGATAGSAFDTYVAAGYRARDGFVTNTQLHRDIDGREASSGLARLRFRPADGVEWTLLATAERIRDGVQALVPLAGPKFEVARGSEGVTQIDDIGLALRGAFELPLGTLSATTAYSRWDMSPAINDLSFGFAEMQNVSELRQRNLSEELSFVSRADGAVRWSGGLFALDGKTTGAFERAFSGFPFESSRYATKHQSLAVYGEAAVHVLPNLTLTPGVRFEENWKKIDREELIPAPGAYRRSRSSGAVLPKLVAAYAIDSSTEASLGLVTGYKPGGFSAFTGNRALTAFDPERLRGVEAAVTRKNRSDTISATLRAYAYRVKGYQIERSFQTGAAADDYLVVNADRARSLGAELEVAWKPVDGLSIALDAGLTRVTLRHFVDPYTHAAYDGNRAPYAPSYDATLRVAYRHASGWFASGSLSAVGRTFYTESEDEGLAQKAYALLGGRVGYAAGRYSIALYGENLTDKEYWASITAGTGHGTPGAPRTYGLEFEARF